MTIFKVEGVETRHGLNFQYKDPEPNFDRRKVRGIAAKLFTVKEERFCQALTTAGGGKLRMVVTEDEKVSKALIQRGGITKNQSYIPLNKISPYVLNKRKIDAAKRVGGSNNVWWAKELIDFDSSTNGAMDYLYGGVLICRDLDIANKVAFHAEVQTPCITLDGDKISPGGDMSGGARAQQANVLCDLFHTRESQMELNRKLQRLSEIEQQLRRVAGVAEQWNNLSQQFELRQHELEMIRNRLKQTLHHQLQEEVEKLVEATKEVNEGVARAKNIVKDGAKKVKDLEYKINNAAELKAKEMKAAEAELKKCKAAAENSKKNWSSKEQEEESIKLELTTLKTSIDSALEQLESVAKSIEGWEVEIETAKEGLKTLTEEVKEAEDAVKGQKDELALKNTEISDKNANMGKIQKLNEERKLSIQEMTHKVKKAADDAENAKSRVKSMLQEYDWIKDDRQSFGKPNTTYDFKATNPTDAGKRIQKLEGAQEKLKKSVNMRAMNMLAKAEEQYNDLIKKKEIVETDKNKIMETIHELDIMKKEALRKAWDQVNKDFGSIFSSILPGTSAKLQPPEGMDVLDGLEVKVAFGGVWKESLTELSGGQRSLVALSLILSLLLFKPAPLYILDEVDAALDLSHTQNIGHMLKTHFKSSQFILVSLKDGMFNNANVLFRTKFVDGMSTVSRTAQHQNPS